MAYQVSDVIPNPVMEIGGVSVYSGTAKVSRAGLAMAKSGEPPQPFGFFLPDAAQLDDGAAEPVGILAEAWLMMCRSHSSGNVMGLDRVGASYAPDPRGGTARWLQLHGTAQAGFGITIGYRVTVQRAA